jgi:hypothetical protein
MRNILIPAAIVAFGLTGAAGATTVFSEDFEGNALTLNGTPTGWTVTSGSVDIIGTGFYEIAGPGTYLDMNGSTGEEGFIETIVSGLTVGDTYTLSFDVAYNSSSAAQLSFYIDYFAGGVGSPIPGSGSSFVTMVYTFTASAASVLLGFADTSGTPGDNQGPLLDNIVVASTVAPVPLPAAGLLLIGGLGGLAALRRRRKA